MVVALDHCLLEVAIDGLSSGVLDRSGPKDEQVAE